MEPQPVSSGYCLTNGFSTLRAVPSDYAFNFEHSTQRLAPTQTLSQYQFSGLNSWRTATQNPSYHYGQDNALPSVAEDGEVNKGNIISLKAFRHRLENLEDGLYRPTIVNGALYMVPSDGNTRTARESHSDTKTAKEAEAALNTAKESDEGGIHTARLNQSPNTKSGIPDVRLSLHQIRRILGRDLCRQVIKKYKAELKAGRMSASGTDIHQEEGLRTAVELSSDNGGSARSSASFHDQPESNCNTAMEPRGSEMLFGGRRSNYDQPESNVNTAVEPTTSQYGTAHYIDSGTSTPVGGPVDDAFQVMLRTAISPANSSSKDVETAREITESVRALTCSSSHGSHGLRNELDSMVAAAENHLAQSYGFLPPDAQRSSTEIYHQGASSKLTHTPENFDFRAGVSAENLGVGHTHLASVEGEVKTAVEKQSETRIQQQ